MGEDKHPADPTTSECIGGGSHPGYRKAQYVFPPPHELHSMQKLLQDYHYDIGAAMSKATHDSLRELNTRWDSAFRQPIVVLSDHARQVGGTIHSFSRLVEAEARLRNYFGKLSDHTTEAMHPSSTLVDNLTAVTEAVDRLDESRRGLISWLVVRPQLEFGAMCDNALSEISDGAKGAAAVSTATAIIGVGGSEATAINEVVIEGIASPLETPAGVLQRPPTMATFNLFDRIDSTLAQLCRHGALSPEASEALALIRACSSEGRNMCHLIYRINKLALDSEGGTVFKRNTELSEVENSLIGLIADNEPHFREFITHMYRIIYEAPGADNNKLAHYVDDQEFQTVQMIKHIRKWHQHAIGNGRTSREARRRAAEAFGILIGKKLPGSTEDYLGAQSSLLMRTNRLLCTVVAKLETATATG